MVAYFPALGTGYIFSRAWHWLNIFMRLAPPGYVFPALTTGPMFSRAWHWLHVFLWPAFDTSCMFWLQVLTDLWHLLRLWWLTRSNNTGISFTLVSSYSCSLRLAVPWYDAIGGYLLFRVNNPHGSFQIWETSVDRKWFSNMKIIKFLQWLQKFLHTHWPIFIVNKWTDTRIYNLCDASNRKKQIYVSFQCICPVIDNEFRHNIVKVVGRSTRLSPRGSTATLTMFENS